MKFRLASTICALIFSFGAIADTGSLAVTDDTTANAVYPDRNFGASTQVAVASWAPKLGFAKFDLSALADLEVDSALLKLHLQWLRTAGSVGLHLVYGEWDEETLTYNSMPSFEPTPFAIIDVSAADVGSTISVDITDVVQTWASGSLANYGISLQPAGKVNIRLDSKETEGGTPMEIEVTGTPGELPCPPGTLLEPYSQVCANVNDITGQFLPPAALRESDDASAGIPAGVRKPDIPNLDELRDREALRRGVSGQAGAPLLARVAEPPIPGGYGAGTRYNLGTHQALEHAILHTMLFVQPDGVNPSEPLEWLMTPATNHTDSAAEFVGIYASHLEGGWLGIFGRPCTEAYPCPDGDTSNGWQAGWTWPFFDSKFACHITDIVDQGGHRQKVMHYANETVRLDQGTPPLWQNAIYLWNYCIEEWDLIWRHEYREDKRDCSVEGCYAWGPILETWGTQSEIDELGFEDTLLFHDGRWSPLAPDETNFVNPVFPWILSHIDPNRSYGVGNRFVPAEAPTVTLTDDTTANAVYPDRNFGDSTQVAVASWAPKLGFAKFDLSALSGAELDSTLLKLHVQWLKTAGSVGLHLVYGEWDEETLTYNSMPSIDPIPFAIIDVSAADVGNTISVDITDVAQQWINGSLVNHGISLQPAGKVNIRLDSKETEGGTEMELETVLAD